jgi:hypothetical protein
VFGNQIQEQLVDFVQINLGGMLENEPPHVSFVDQIDLAASRFRAFCTPGIVLARWPDVLPRTGIGQLLVCPLTVLNWIYALTLMACVGVNECFDDNSLVDGPPSRWDPLS